MKPILTIMAALFCAHAGAQTETYPSDIIRTADGRDLKITFFGHGSIAFEFEGRHIYIDPVGDYADYKALSKAFGILLTHEHGDHLDPKAIKAISARRTPPTLVYGNATAIEALGHGKVMEYGDEHILYGTSDQRKTTEGVHIVTVEAVPAYNTSPEKQNFHPKARVHNGYILTFGGTRVYVAGDGEDTPEMLALKDIDIAFLPVNLPYTMTEEQAARAVKAIRPGIFYPYHYGGTDHKTDLGKLEKLIEDSGVEMRIRPLE